MNSNELASFSQLNQIAEKLNLIYNEDPWYGRSITEVLKSVNKDHIFDVPDKAVHSIAELVSHMITWRKFAERRLQGDNKYLPDQEESFNWKRISDNKKEVWDMLLERLRVNQENLLTLLKQNNDSLLEQTVEGKPYTFRYLLDGLIQHDLYHLGQIAYIQKLQPPDL